MKQYTGFCVDGPLKGTHQDCAADMLRVFYSPESSRRPFQEISDVPTQQTAETVFYKHVIGLRGEVEVDFWTCEDKTAGKCIALIFNEWIRGFGKKK